MENIHNCLAESLAPKVLKDISSLFVFSNLTLVGSENAKAPSLSIFIVTFCGGEKVKIGTSSSTTKNRIFGCIFLQF